MSKDSQKDRKLFNDGLHDGQELMKFVATRIIDHELKSWGRNTNNEFWRWYVKSGKIANQPTGISGWGSNAFTVRGVIKELKAEIDRLIIEKEKI